MKFVTLITVLLSFFSVYAQVPIARDTLTVFENGKVLKMPWANGINHSNVSSCDLNNDGLKDLVVFDRINVFGTGRFRVFIKTGSAGQAKYQAAQHLSYFFPQCSNWAVMVDYNCDGKEDIFTSVSSGIKVYKNVSGTSGPAFQLVTNLLGTDYGGNNGKTNLYASGVGVPGISDIDNDGDLDILTFSPQGVLMEYHRNMSIEKGYACDSLVFNAIDLCWGKIAESQCEVSMNQCQPKSFITQSNGQSKEYHAGSCLMCFDSDGDNDTDLIMGDISCNTVHYVHNTGTSGAGALFSDTTALYPNYPQLGNTTVLKMNNFPCTYHVDVDGDGLKDLVATPNAAGSENYRSVWYYKNASATPTVNFQFVQNNLLQDEMIEVGQTAFPVSLDENGDGKKDLLIGTFGYYDNNTLSARLTLYRNISTNATPVYSLITRNYAGLSSQNLSYAMPATGDIDGDGDTDILIGTLSGQVHWLKNSGGAGNPCNFSQFLASPFSFTTISAVAAPQLFDLDGDNLLDLIIGMKNGRVAYYRNIGTSTAPSFSLITNALGQIDVKGDPYLFGLDGYAVPYFYNENGSTYALIGSVTGGLWFYQVTSLTGSFTKINEGLNGINEGSQATALFEDLDGDLKRDLIIGNGSGGLSYFSSSSPYVNLNEYAGQRTELTIFPNPASDYMILGGINAQQNTVLFVYDLSGRLLLQQNVNAGSPVIRLNSLQPGLYVVVVSGETGGETQVQTQRLIIE